MEPTKLFVTNCPRDSFTWCQMIRELQFKFITQRYADEIYRYAKGLLGDPTEAEDAVQEVLLRFWQNLAEVQITKSRAWLYRTTRNHCIDLLRQRKAINHPLYLDDDQLSDVVEEDQIDPSRQADLETIKTTVESAI
jgi:RNA polymerase sigma factor (sigma-70 family)